MTDPDVDGGTTWVDAEWKRRAETGKALLAAADARIDKLFGALASANAAAKRRGEERDMWRRRAEMAEAELATKKKATRPTGK